MAHIPQRTMADYADMLQMERPVSARHRPMPLQDRAAQFAPFAALTAYGDLIDENSRYVGPRQELDEERRAALDDTLNRIKNGEGEKSIRVIYFVPDALKEGGTYENYEGTVRRIDEIQKMIYFKDKKAIRLENVFSIEISNDGSASQK